MGWASAIKSTQSSADISKTTECKKYRLRLAASTEKCEFETTNKCKAFTVKRDSGKRVVIDNSFLLVKTDALQNLSKDFFLNTGKLRHENSLWTG